MTSDQMDDNLSTGDMEKEWTFLQKLIGMDPIDEDHIKEEEEDENKMIIPKKLNFLQFEDIWLSEQASRFRQAYLDVSLGADFLREFVMHSFDVPLSKSFVPQVALTNAERYRRALTVFQPAFTDSRCVCMHNVFVYTDNYK